MAAGLESSFYLALAHLLALLSNGTGAGHMFVATLCVLQKKQTAKVAKCRSSFDK